MELLELLNKTVAKHPHSTTYIDFLERTNLIHLQYDVMSTLLISLQFNNKKIVKYKSNMV